MYLPKGPAGLVSLKHKTEQVPQVPQCGEMSKGPRVIYSPGISNLLSPLLSCTGSSHSCDVDIQWAQNSVVTQTSTQAW